MGGFISVEQSPPDHHHNMEAFSLSPPGRVLSPPGRALSPPGRSLLEPYKDKEMPRPGSGILEPMAGFLDFNQFKEALDIESVRVFDNEDIAISDSSSSSNASQQSAPIFFPVELEFDKLFDWS